MKCCPSCGLVHDSDLGKCPVKGTPLCESAASGPPDARVGEVLHERYRLEGVLGSGAMGTVYRASDGQAGEPVAVKVLRDRERGAARSAERLLREARIGELFRHVNIVRYLDAGATADGAPFVVMELLRGESLRARLARDGRLTVCDAGDLAEQMLSGLGALHAAGVVHRDLKPDNLFLEPRSDERTCVKLLDFGLAKNIFETGSALTGPGEVVGTLLYLSPEQAKGLRGEIDHRTDIWAAGVVLYEALTGVPPFEGSTIAKVALSILGTRPTPPSTLRPELGANVDDVLLTAMARPPAARFQGAEAMKAALRVALRGSDGPFEEELRSPGS